jgi:hypothetical protein
MCLAAGRHHVCSCNSLTAWLLLVYRCVHHPTCIMFVSTPASANLTDFRFLLKNSNDGSDGNNSSNYDLPMECPSQGPRPCTGTNFRPVDEGPGSACYTNHQELRVQQQLQCLEPGSVPASISLVLQDELADSCQPGGANSNIVTSFLTDTCMQQRSIHTGRQAAVFCCMSVEAGASCCCGARILCSKCCRPHCTQKLRL